MQTEASALAAAALDELDSNVEALVGEVFTACGEPPHITLGHWRQMWHQAAASGAEVTSPIHRIMGVDTV